MNVVYRVILVALLLALSSKFSFAAGLCGSDSMFFNGSHTSWVVQPMTCNESTGKWELKNVLLPENSLVGFDIEGNWTYTYGGRGGLSGKISNRYENIWVAKSGIYDIEVDLQQKTYVLLPTESQDLSTTQSKDLSATLGLLPESGVILGNNSSAKALARCSRAECYRQYERDSANCRRIRNTKGRAICWAAAATRYGACLAVCR